MALYNNGFPVTYPQYYTPVAPVQVQQPQPYTPVQQAQNGRIWVQGEAGARSYLVAPNNTVELWDSESQTLYLKSADATGMPSIKVLDYTIRDSARNTPVSASGASDNKMDTYATKEQIEAINDQIKALKKKVEKLTKEDGNE
jgi:hypothetical protein